MIEPLSAAATAAAPAVLAAGAYLNARWKLSQDISTIFKLVKTKRALSKREQKDRVNSFYLLEEHALNKDIADKPCIIFEGKSWTFKEIYDNALRYAGWLHHSHGVSKGDVVALDFMNSVQFISLILALWSLGAIPAMINYNLVGKPFLHCVRVSGAKCLVVDPELETNLLTNETREALQAPDFREDSQPFAGFVVFDQELQSSLANQTPYRAPDTARSLSKSTCASVYIFTSGTTGLPKPAVMPWTRVFSSSAFALLFDLQPVNRRHPDRFYTCMPLYHTTAFVLGFHMCLVHAVTVVIGRKFSVKGFWPEVRASQATAIQYVGETLRYLLATPPSTADRSHSVRLAFGNGLRPDVWDKFKTRFGIDTIAEMYGATEAVAASWNVNRNKDSNGAVGNYGLLLDMFARQEQILVEVDWENERPARDPKTGFCIPVPRGQVGELLYVVAPKDIEAKFQGYLGNKKATESKIVRDVLVKGDVYYRTGDTLRWDKNGLLWFSDRIGDTFRWKSENVSTSEVGEILGTHPSVFEANVYGVEVPGHDGRAGCAAVLLREEALQDKQDLVEVKPEVLESLASYVSKSLPKYAIPIFLRVGREFATTGTNKQQKHELRLQGIDLEAIRRAGKDDTIYWLKPGSGRYVLFKSDDLQALKRSEVRL